MDTPVLYCIFNRLDMVKKTFPLIRAEQPKRLYIASDGPRINVDGEPELVANCRKFVLENIDWECEVKTLFRGVNFGCSRAMTDAIRWFFNQEEAGIVIEDDILTSPQFFRFMEIMLDKYKNDENVGYVVGYNKISLENCREDLNIQADYVFLPGGQEWGWASWRRAVLPCSADSFDYYSPEKFYAKNILYNYKKYEYGRIDLDLFFKRLLYDFDIWDFDFCQYHILRNAYAIVPIKNLTSHIGAFGTGFSGDNPFDIQIEELDYKNLRHPSEIRVVPSLRTFFATYSYYFLKFKKYGCDSINFNMLNQDLLLLLRQYLYFYRKYHVCLNKNKRKKNKEKLNITKYALMDLLSFWIYVYFYKDS